MTTILVTCVGSGVGQSVIDSLNLQRDFRIIGCDGNPNVYAHSFCDKLYVVPSLYSEGYTDYILKLCLENQVDVVIPGHDHELVIFAKEYDKFKSNGIEVIVSEPKLIAISRDKQEWYDFFTPLGCKIVPTVSVKEFLKSPDTDILPAIVKPSGGSASQGISIINDLKELEGLNEEDIIQPYLFPEKTDKNYEKIYSAVKKGNFLQMSEISIQLIFNSESKFSGIFISKNSLKSGVPVYVDPINPEEFEYTYEIMKFVPILESHGVKGPVNIQGRITPKGLFFFEMNMRFTGITGNRALLGFNEVDFLVRNFLGMDAYLGTYAPNKVGVRQVACTTITRQYKPVEREALTVLGGGSTIGRCFIEKYNNEFQEINLIVRSTSIEKYDRVFKEFKNVNLISEDSIRLEEIFCRTDILINFASALAFEDDVNKYNAIRYIQKLIPKIAKARISKVINISSQSVYPQDLNVEKDESSEIKYSSAYAFQKVLIEDMFKSIGEFCPLTKVVSLRLPRVIAPKIDGQAGFFGLLIEQLKQNASIELSSPQNNTNLIHIDDAISSVQFLNRYLDENYVYDNVYNVSGENISLRSYVEAAKSILNSNSELKFSENEVITQSSMINGDKFQSLGWKPEEDISSIIKEF